MKQAAITKEGVGTKLRLNSSVARDHLITNT